MATPLVGGGDFYCGERERAARDIWKSSEQREGEADWTWPGLSSEHREAEESQRRARKRIVENLGGWGSVMIPFRKFLDNAGFYLTCQKSFYCLA